MFEEMNIPTADIDKLIVLEKLRLAQKVKDKQIAKENRITETLKMAQKEKEENIEQIRLRQLEEQTKQKELEKRSYGEESHGRKRHKTLDENVIVTSGESSTSVFTHQAYYKLTVTNNLHPFNVKSLLNDYHSIEDSMVKVFEDGFLPLMLKKVVLKESIQRALDASIKKLFGQFNYLTSLKYLNTTNSKYLLQKKQPDCTFIYKNININTGDEQDALQDFVICLGELKSSNESIDTPAHVEELAKYLVDILDIQNRKKVYGFITNLQYIRFYYAVQVTEQSTYKSCYNFYQSQKLNMFYMPSDSTSSSAGAPAAAINNHSCPRDIDKDTIKIFIKFITMNPAFYEYEMLQITPDDYLFGDEFYIKKRLGYGLTSMVYLLADNNYNGISRFILFEAFLSRFTSIELTQAEQLISILEYLYKHRIIHRDIRRENLMVDKRCNHIKLIDFGFAATFKDDDNTIKLEIEGVVSCGGLTFLETYLKELSEATPDIQYNYERTFDLQCGLNVIMYMKDSEIGDRFEKWKRLSLAEKVHKLYKFWLNLKQTDQNYNDLLDLIEEVSNVSDFEPIKHRIKVLF